MASEKAPDEVVAKDRAAWRRWLERNHATSAGVWLLVGKKGSGIASVTYEEAVEEALCFGWIDAKANRLDDTRFKQRMTPRRPGSGWAASNKARVERLIARGGVLLIHVGSAPWPNEYDGFPRFQRVMTMFPELTVIVAHMGQWETRRHLGLMPRCPNMYLDTTAAMAPGSPIFLGGPGASPADVTDADLVHWQDRIVFGSDFPNTPHDYEDERRPIWERPLPLSVHRKIFHDNARRLLGL